MRNAWEESVYCAHPSSSMSLRGRPAPSISQPERCLPVLVWAETSQATESDICVCLLTKQRQRDWQYAGQ
jgi:hypothetical protein